MRNIQASTACCWIGEGWAGSTAEKEGAEGGALGWSRSPASARTCCELCILSASWPISATLYQMFACLPTSISACHLTVWLPKTCYSSANSAEYPVAFEFFSMSLWLIFCVSFYPSLCPCISVLVCFLYSVAFENFFYVPLYPASFLDFLFFSVLPYIPCTSLLFHFSFNNPFYLASFP